MSLAEWWPWALLVALGATALVALLYRRPDLRPGWRVAFVLLRGIAITLAALLFADLACQIQRPLESPAAALVIDDSASMSLADAVGRTRAGYAEELAENLRTAHPDLDWSVYRLGELSAADTLEAVEKLASRRPDLAAVVVAGDGGGRIPVAGLDAPFPVYAVAVGGASKFDVALDAPRGPRLALAGKSALFQVDVRLVGNGPTEATVRASAREVFGGRREVELDPTVADLSEGAAVALFHFTPPVEGWWLVEFETPTLESEATPLNNVRRLLVDVRQGEMTALVLAGEPGPDSSFLQRSLGRLPGVEASLLYRRADGAFYDADGKARKPEPVAPDALFLVDLVPQGELLSEISRRIAEGRGVGLLLGRPGLVVPAGGALRELFPIPRDTGDVRLVDGQARVVQATGGPFGGLAGADLPALLTYPQGLRDADGSPLVLENPSGRRVPGATLAASGAPRVVMWGRGWWRWALDAGGEGENPYDVLVSDLFAYLSSPVSDGRLLLTLDRRRAVTGRAVGVEITGVAGGEPECSVRGIGDEGGLAVELTEAREGRWRGSFTAEGAGAYVVRAELGGQTAEEPLVVEPDFSEFVKLSPDAPSLALLASLGGGRLLYGPEDELPLGPGATPEVYGREPLRASPWLLGALILVVVGEWFLRRRQNLR
ncbi:MAG: hypothetical protein NTW26_11400 [bacterium]|nr:hypothetical protein [bacterium]